MTSVLEKTGAMPAPMSASETEQPFKQALAWSEEDNLSEAEHASLRGVRSNELPILDSEEIIALEQAIEQAPNADEALEVVSKHDTGIYHTMSLLEKVMSVYGNSGDVTDKINTIVDKAIGGAERAIAGEVDSTAPNDVVLGLIKGLDITRDPELKAKLANILDSGITLAEQNNQLDNYSNNYLLDPIIAASAKEVVADIRHAAPDEAIGAEELFESHSRVHALYAERAAIEAQLAEVDQRIAAEYEMLETIAPKRTFMTAVRSMLRFSR